MMQNESRLEDICRVTGLSLCFLAHWIIFTVAMLVDTATDSKCLVLFLFLIYVGCPCQLTRTMTIPHGPLDIHWTAQEQVRHRGGDRRVHRGSNPGRGRNKSHCWPQQLDPQVQSTDARINFILWYFDRLWSVHREHNNINKINFP
jgi:hypothetical protein